MAAEKTSVDIVASRFKDPPADSGLKKFFQTSLDSMSNTLRA